MTARPRFPSASKFKKPDAYLDAIYRYMTRITLATLYANDREGHATPDAEWLADWLRAEMAPHARRLSLVADYQDSSSKGKWSGMQYETNLERAAEWCLSVFDPDTIHARAVVGGKRSRRGPSFTLADLAPYDGLSITQQAKALGCSVRTVSNLRRRASMDPFLRGDFDRPTPVPSSNYTTAPGPLDWLLTHTREPA